MNLYMCTSLNLFDSSVSGDTGSSGWEHTETCGILLFYEINLIT